MCHTTNEWRPIIPEIWDAHIAVQYREGSPPDTLHHASLGWAMYEYMAAAAGQVVYVAGVNRKALPVF